MSDLRGGASSNGVTLERRHFCSCLLPLRVIKADGTRVPLGLDTQQPIPMSPLIRPYHNAVKALDCLSGVDIPPAYSVLVCYALLQLLVRCIAWVPGGS